MDFPLAFKNIIREVFDAYSRRAKPADKQDDVQLAAAEIQAITEASVARITQHECFADFANNLIFLATREQVYALRHANNVQIRRDAGHYNTRSRSGPQGSKAVDGVYRSCYAYYIAGRTLGTLLGSELESVERSERNTATGHNFNADLIQAIRFTKNGKRRVPDDQTVQQVLSEENLQGIFVEVRNRYVANGYSDAGD